MCYSKEVQLTTGSAILLFCLYYYIHYSIKYEAMHKKWLLPFLKYLILAYAFIGGHQFFEFLSLASGNQIIYKIGLMLSMTGMFFYLISLEKLYNRNFQAKYFLIGLVGVAVHMFSVNMEFEATKFHLSHNSVFIWAAYWTLMFIYFHFCAFLDRKHLQQDISKKAILGYVLAIFDISFLLSAIYAIWGYSQFNVNVCTDSPSIWCTFSVFQVFSLPLFLTLLPKLLQKEPEKTKLSVKKYIYYLLASIVVLVALIAVLPFFDCLTVKFVFP
jgi:hypothetical protein